MPKLLRLFSLFKFSCPTHCEAGDCKGNLTWKQQLEPLESTGAVPHIQHRFVWNAGTCHTLPGMFFFYRCWSLRWHIGGFCFAQAKTSGNPAGVVQQRVKRLALQYIGESHMWLAIYIMNHHDRLSTKNWTAFPKARTTKPHQTCGCVCSACTLCRLCAWWHVFCAVVLALVLHQAGPVTAPYGSYRFNVFLGMMHCNSSHAYYKNIYDNMKTYEKHIVKQSIQLPTGVWHPNRAHGRCRWCLASRERVLWGRVAGRW